MSLYKGALFCGAHFLVGDVYCKYYMENQTQHPVSSVKTAPKHPKFVRFALLAGIVVVLNVFFFVVVQTIISVPKYSTYCPQPTKQATSSATCEAQGGVWKGTSSEPVPSTSKTVSKEKSSGYCNYYVKCQTSYDTARENARLYSFVLMTVLGVVALVIGVVPIGVSIVSSGLSYGGVLALIIGSIQYWGSADSLLRLVISGFALVTLIYLGMRRFQDER